ncbi:F-box protein SKIP8 isoform B [Glycine soja]|uniref:F-box protein SKIP8 isoform B n=1 Tax=Glycine soja TaxID=3848 RepID=A0A445J8U4_GLYSO|nr:F-box protein SKIP8 isoform B [Glycine soja]
MEIFSVLSEPFLVALAVTALCFLFALFSLLRSSFSLPRRFTPPRKHHCDCTSNSDAAAVPYLNGGRTEMLEPSPVPAPAVLTERRMGSSMMEELVPEITTHALSYLDYPSLCRLSMTNSLMRKAANDDNAWKALYHKDFTLEQDSITPTNGWKAYYAATRAIVNINTEFFNIVRDKSLQAMSHFWLNADYVKCIHASGFFSGYDFLLLEYNAVMQGWQLVFNWEQGLNFQVRDVCARVLTDMAWVTMKTYVDMDTGPFNVTNIYEFHNGRWYMVHHHSSVDGDVDHQIVHG